MREARGRSKRTTREPSLVKMAGPRGARAERPARENVITRTRSGTSAAPQPAAGNNGASRRALGDIGNLTGAMALRCQVSKDGGKNPPIKRVSTLLVTTTAVDTREAVNDVHAVTSEIETATAHARDEAVIEHSVDGNVADDAKNNSIHVAGEHLPQVNSAATAAAVMRNVPTLTATLTARSEATGKCDIEMIEADEVMHNIDEDDADDQLCVVDYVEDIYAFYRQAEMKSYVAPDYMSRQSDINDKMRSILVDWLIEVHLKFGLMPETLFLTMNLLDRYLSVQSVTRKNLQLVGVTAILIAAKYEEIMAPEVESIVYISDDAYTREQVLAMEKAMLSTLQFNLTVPTPYVFLMRFLKAAPASDKQMELLAFFYVELCLTEYKAIRYPSSLQAAAAVYTALQTLHISPCWTPTLVRHSGYGEPQLGDCANMMLALHRKAAEAKSLVVHKKYSSSKFQAVAALTPATLNFPSH